MRRWDTGTGTSDTFTSEELSARTPQRRQVRRRDTGTGTSDTFTSEELSTRTPQRHQVRRWDTGIGALERRRLESNKRKCVCRACASGSHITLEKVERELMGLWESTWKLKASMHTLKRPDYFRSACSLPGFSGLMFTGKPFPPGFLSHAHRLTFPSGSLSHAHRYTFPVWYSVSCSQVNIPCSVF